MNCVLFKDNFYFDEIIDIFVGDRKNKCFIVGNDVDQVFIIV